MGLDVYGNLIIGVPVTRADFFTKVGTELRCAHGHVKAAKSSARFCDQDGSKFREEPVEEATAAFRAWAGEKKYDPDKFWDILSETWSSGIGIHCVDTISSCESSESMALGFRVAKTGSACECADKGTLGLTLEFIAGKMAEAEELARKLGIDRKAQLFLNLYASY